MATLGIMGLVSIIGTGLSVMGQIQQNKAQSDVAEFEAKQAEAKGKEERAAAQREALDKQEQANYLLSRERAVAAASGAGLETPSVVDIYTKTAQRGEYQEAAIRYGGESRQRGYEDKAAALRAGSGGDTLGIIGSALSGLSKSNIFG